MNTIKIAKNMEQNIGSTIKSINEMERVNRDTVGIYTAAHNYIFLLGSYDYSELEKKFKEGSLHIVAYNYYEAKTGKANFYMDEV
jgi:hypothetical protein